MSSLRPALSLLVCLVVACGSDPEAAQTGSSGGGGAEGGASGTGGGGGGQAGTGPQGAGQAGAGGGSAAGAAGVGSVGDAGGGGSPAAGGGGSAGAAGTSGASGGSGDAGAGMGGALAAGQAGAAGGTGGAEAGGAGGALSGQGGDAGGGQAGVGGAAAACELPATLLCDCKSPRSPTARGEWTCPPGATEKVCDCTSAPPPPKDVNLTACNDADGSDESHKAACVGDTEFPVCQVIVEGKSWVTSYCANPKSGPKKLDNGGIFFDVKCCKPIEPLPPMGVRIAA